MRAEADGKFRQKRHTEAERQRKYDTFERDHNGHARQWFRAKPYVLQYQEQMKNITERKGNRNV